MDVYQPPSNAIAVIQATCNYTVTQSLLLLIQIIFEPLMLQIASHRIAYNIWTLFHHTCFPNSSMSIVNNINVFQSLSNILNESLTILDFIKKSIIR